MPKRERYLFVCTNERPENHPMGSCARRGSRELLASLKQAVSTAGLKDQVRVCGATCLDVCWDGPAIAMTPDQAFLGHVSEADVAEIVQALARGERVERLELPEDRFDNPAKKDEGPK